MTTTPRLKGLALWGGRNEVVSLPPPDRSSSVPHQWTALYLASRPLPAKVSAIHFDITSHDQGYGNPQNGLWSWFEVSILGAWAEEPDPNLFHDLSDPAYVRSSPEEFGEWIQEQGLYFKNLPMGHAQSSGDISTTLVKNNLQSQWQQQVATWKRGGNEDEKSAEHFLDLIEEGDRLVIWARVRFPGWRNEVKEAQITVSAPVLMSDHGESCEKTRIATPTSITPRPHAKLKTIQQFIQEQALLALGNAAVQTRDAFIASMNADKNWWTCMDPKSGRSRHQKSDTATERILRKKEELSRLPDNDPGRASVLRSIAFAYEARQPATSQEEEESLNKAIEYSQLAVQAKPEQLAYRMFLIMNLQIRYGRAKQSTDLDLIITEIESIEALGGHSNFVFLLGFGAFYITRYDETGNTDDLQNARDIFKEVRHIVPKEDFLVQIMTSGLEEKHMAYIPAELAIGEKVDTHIDNAERAIALAEVNSTIYLQLLHNLFEQYYRRYLQTGHSRDIDLAIARAEESLSLEVSKNDSIIRWHTANSFMARWHRQGRREDYDKAQELTKSAIDAAISGSAEQIGFIVQRAVWMATEDPDRTDQTQALRASIEEVENIRAHSYDGLTPRYKKQILCALGGLYKDLYGLTHDIADLDKAIDSMEAFFGLNVDDTSSNRLIMGNLWLAKASRTNDTTAYRRGLRSFQRCYESDQALPIDRVRGASCVMHHAIHHLNWTAARRLAEEIIFPLIPLISSRDLKHDDKTYNLQSLSGLAGHTCVALLRSGSLTEALLKVEISRGILIGDLIDLRRDLSNLHKVHEDLALEYNMLREKALRDIHVDEPQPTNNRRGAFQLLQQCESRIRERMGFENFLQPVTLPDIIDSSREGPIVVVNVTCVSSDAILITPDWIKHLPLDSMISHSVPQFRHQLLRMRCTWKSGPRDLESDLPPEAQDVDLLSWLWYTCVKPILELLASHNSISSRQKSRVWWIGVGAASGLPFHAAGDYTTGPQDENTANENCLDRVISSYTPTIKTLQNSRRNAQRRAAQAPVQPEDSPSLLIATMADTPGHGTLHGVRREAKAIIDTVKHAMHVKHMAEPSADEILAQISACQLVHFACHGHSDPEDPAESHMLLKKRSGSGFVVDKLTVSQLLDQATSCAWIAYLSACSTAENRAEKLRDEGIHVTTGFLIAGFPHVIGSLWPANDQVCVYMAAFFYEALIRRLATTLVDPNRAVAEAVHDATLRIRRQYYDSPMSWALYTHNGA
ncbi:CHAT domain-containing protein [Aspergillus brunneoviolaceus CBS 621.78]|uniref:Uncharacterized protein n=1 Tax=Aspergillus brunneoviolaceus CBS 621.78 TaxID=1450534 RepID=A0ACD1GHK4_9EURO|nr:hypothetical protein BO95DRAFT_407889 [Aspergillus brunneoviolaceus CBS 621.78]RAH48713.1 hypothetical protein BO95DRAFT_407889 [Aspergillus brunneoviolaceus CBS 621.78]